MPYTPQQNGPIERKHRYIVELALATMFHADIPHQYWPDIFESVTYIINRLPTSSTSFSSPFHALFNKSPDYSLFQVIGCKCYPFTRHHAPHKLAPRSSCCVLLGYFHQYKGYKCLNLRNNKILMSKHILFDEHSFPFKNIQPI
jgi:hypothetical protein